MSKNIVLPIPMTSIASSAVTGTYQAINTGGTPQACLLLKIVNNSTSIATLSWDGTHDHDIVPADSIVLYDFQANHQPNSDVSLVAKGTTIYVKGSAGTGSIYLIGFFNPVASD